MHQLNVAVLRGGPSGEYDISLQTGQNILKHLSLDKYKIEDIFVDKSGVWHKYGLPTTPNDVLRNVDVLFNAMHGEYGEDGQLQRIAEDFSVAYTGSNAFGASLSLNKDLAKKEYKKNYLKTPNHLVLKATESDDLHSIAFKIFREFPQPSIIKPLYGGSSKDVYYCSSYEDAYYAIDNLSKKGQPFLIEEFIFGKEASTAVLEGFRDEPIYSFSPIEVAKNKPIYSYEQKLGTESRDNTAELGFTNEERAILKELAREAHQALHLRHYSQSDFIISPRGIYILETDTLPSISKHSIISKAFKEAGVSISDFLDHVIKLAIK